MLSFFPRDALDEILDLIESFLPTLSKEHTLKPGSYLILMPFWLQLLSLPYEIEPLFYQDSRKYGHEVSFPKWPDIWPNFKT